MAIRLKSPLSSPAQTPANNITTCTVFCCLLFVLVPPTCLAHAGTFLKDLSSLGCVPRGSSTKTGLTWPSELPQKGPAARQGHLPPEGTFRNFPKGLSSTSISTSRDRGSPVPQPRDHLALVSLPAACRGPRSRENPIATRDP